MGSGGSRGDEESSMLAVLRFPLGPLDDRTLGIPEVPSHLPCAPMLVVDQTVRFVAYMLYVRIGCVCRIHTRTRVIPRY